MSTLLLQAFAKLPPPEETPFPWDVAMAFLIIGLLIGIALIGILTSGKRRDEYQAGYLAGFQEGLKEYGHTSPAITPPTIKISPRILKRKAI